MFIYSFYVFLPFPCMDTAGGDTGDKGTRTLCCLTLSVSNKSLSPHRIFFLNCVKYLKYGWHGPWYMVAFSKECYGSL